jgi:hypothetical protein
MADTNPHVVAMPRWSRLVGIARLVLAVVVLALTAAAADLWESAEYAAFGLALFTVRLLPLLFYPPFPSSTGCA